MPNGLRQNLLFKLINFWPPYFGAGVRVKHVDMKALTLDVEMKLHFWNKNYVGTQFGGSLYAMCDPFFMLLLMEALGREYIVWDKAAAIRFKKPGKGTVHTRFHIPHEQVEEIRERLKTEYKLEPQFQLQILDQEGDVIAEVDKTLYVRRKDAVKPAKVATQA
jgi:hypothetical protein